MATGCELLEEHYEPFALGVLEGSERAEIQAHLDEGCPVCVPAVRRASELVGRVALASPEAVPPAALRRKLLATIQAQQPKRLRLPVWSWAVAAALAIACLVLGAGIRERNRELAQLSRLNDELQDRDATYRRALAILSAPGTRSVALAAVAPASPQVNAYWNEIAGLVLTGRHMPALPPNRTYQLWVVPKKGNPVSAGTFEPGAQGLALLISRPAAKPAEAAALAITDEPAGGRPQPTTKPIWVGPLG